MGLTKLNFNEIENASETSNIININKTVTLNQEVILPTKTPTVNQSDGTIWVDQASNNLKIKINSVTYDLSPQTDYNNINVTSPSVISLNGDTGIVNNLTISGSGTVLEIRSSAIGGVQWSNLEILGDLNIASGTTLRLTRIPLIVRGSIIGSGTITSPDGVNGGAAGVGGPGGTFGLSGVGATGTFAAPTPGIPGGASPSTWPNMNGSSGSSMSVEYGVSSGAGGPGGRGTGGGGGGGDSRGLGYAWPGGSSGAGSNPVYSGAPGVYYDLREGYYYAFQYSGGGGGAGGGASGPTGGPGAPGQSGTNGISAGSLSVSYTGIGTPSSASPGSAGTFGGQGGTGGTYIHPDTNFGTAGSPGGSGGNGGAGGGTGGAHISIYAGGPISTSINIRTGKGGLTGGSTSLPRAQTGSLWLFTPTGSESISGIDLTGASGTPTGPSGISNRYAITNSTEVSNFFTGILYEASGITPAKTKRAISVT